MDWPPYRVSLQDTPVPNLRFHSSTLRLCFASITPNLSSIGLSFASHLSFVHRLCLSFADIFILCLVLVPFYHFSLLRIHSVQIHFALWRRPNDPVPLPSIASLDIGNLSIWHHTCYRSSQSLVSRAEHISPAALQRSVVQKHLAAGPLETSIGSLKYTLWEGLSTRVWV